MEYAICLLPAVPMRAMADHRAEMVSQLLFGETCRVLQRRERWCQVKGSADGYEGWVDAKQLTALTEAEYGEALLWDGVTDIPMDLLLLDGAPMRVPMGSSLPKGGKATLAGHSVAYVSDGDEEERPGVQEVAILMHGAPYLWGGKTVFGTDCSGLVQTVMKVCGTALPRDAAQQACVGTPVERFEDMEEDDLVFFQNEEGRVVHVGICCGNGEIIHSSGRVRIDLLDERGIRDRWTGEYSHRFHSIRRVGRR